MFYTDALAFCKPTTYRIGPCSTYASVNNVKLTSGGDEVVIIPGLGYETIVPSVETDLENPNRTCCSRHWCQIRNTVIFGIIWNISVHVNAPIPDGGYDLILSSQILLRLCARSHEKGNLSIIRLFLQPALELHAAAKRSK